MSTPIPRVTSRASKAGMPPGSLVHVGTPKSTKTVIYAARYSKDDFIELPATTIKEALALRKPGTTLWINIDGLSELDVLKESGEAFNIHPLVLEDISNPHQRPKAEYYQNYCFIVLRAFSLSASGKIDSEQVSLVLGKDFLISVQEKEGDAFKALGERLRNPESRLRNSGTDFLAYSALDTIVDVYFTVLEKFGSHLEELETQIVQAPNEKSLNMLYQQKRKGLQLRRAIWPVRELLSNLERTDCAFFTPDTRIYMRDVYSHVIEVIDTLEIYREMLSGLLDVYLSSLSNRLNEVMKVLTVITTIFMPLSFIAGVYGMNFHNMPELDSAYGYPIVLVLMLLIGVMMFSAFRRKRWI